VEGKCHTLTYLNCNIAGIAVILTVRRYIWKLCPNYLEYLIPEESTGFDELKLQKCLLKHGHIPNHVQVKALEESQAADYFNYVVNGDSPDTYIVHNNQSITDIYGNEYVYLHFGSSKRTDLSDRNFPWSCDTPIPMSYQATFDSKNKKTTLQLY